MTQAASSPLLPPVATPNTAQTTQTSNLSVKLICGAIAGITGTLIIFPLDMVKTRLQNQRAGDTVKYKGGIDCFRTIVRTEGVRGLYRGLIPNLVGITPEKAIKLAVNDYTREYLARRINAHPDSLPIHYGMLAGAFAGTCQVIATNPMEMVKINAQMSALSGRPKTGGEIVSELGLRGLYRGTAATLLRDVPFSFIFFPASAYFKQMAGEYNRKNGGDGKVSFGAVFGSGIAAGILASGTVTPSDVIKTRLQTKRADAPKYTGIAHAASDIYAKEGLGAFFKGATQRCMIIAPLFGITLLVYEAQQKYFSNLGLAFAITSSVALNEQLDENFTEPDTLVSATEIKSWGRITTTYDPSLPPLTLKNGKKTSSDAEPLVCTSEYLRVGTAFFQLSEWTVSFHPPPSQSLSPKFPLRIHHIPSDRDSFLYLPSASIKEDVFMRIRYKGVHPFQVVPTDSTTCWFNAILARAFYSASKNGTISKKIEEIMDKQVAKLKRPAFLGPLIVKDVEAGLNVPILSHAKLLSSIDSQIIDVKVDLDYEGGFRFELETEARMESVSMTFPVVISILVKRIRGQLLLRMKPPPSTRIWYGFYSKPDLELDIRPKVSSTSFNFAVVCQTIEKKIRQTIRDLMVLPNMNDFKIPFTHSEWEDVDIDNATIIFGGKKTEHRQSHGFGDLLVEIDKPKSQRESKKKSKKEKRHQKSASVQVPKTGIVTNNLDTKRSVSVGNSPVVATLPKSPLMAVHENEERTEQNIPQILISNGEDTMSREQQEHILKLLEKTIYGASWS